MILKLKNSYTIASACKKFYITILNEEMNKNKNIHHYYKCKRLFDAITL